MIETLLLNKNAKERAQIKSQELAKVVFSNAFTKDRIKIKIVGDITEIEGGIQLFAQAWKNGKQLGFGKDGSIDIERFRFFNPPVLVDDINGDIIRKDSKDIDGKIQPDRKLKYDPQEAIKQSLAHTISLVAKDDKNIVKGKIGNTTSTFYPDAGTGNTTVEGMVRRYDRATWIDARDTVTAIDVLSTTTWGRVGIRIDSNLFTVYRYIATLDTSTIGADEISSAYFSVYAITGTTANISGNFVSVVQSNGIANPNSIVVGDYDVVGDAVNNPTKGSADKLVSTFSISQYNDITLNATGIGWINKTGITYLGLREKGDMENIAPTGENDSQVDFSSSDETGTAQDPKLVVVHSAVTNSNFFAFMA